MWCDETAEQTRRIHLAQRNSKTLDGRRVAKQREAIIRRHQNAQRLLQQVGVVIPFADLIDFPYQWLRTRRDNLRFLNLIEAITFLYQHQRAKREDQDNTSFVEATIEDYERAYMLAKDVLGQTLADVKKPAAEFYASVQALAVRKGDAVTRREIREATGLPDHRVIALLHELVQLEYLEIVSGGFGKTLRYRLTNAPTPTASAIPGLTTPEELRAKIEARADNLVNGSARFSQGGQPAETKGRKRR